MRVTAEEKAKIKERILHEAIPFLKKSGLDGAPVDQIMKHVGLTSGALYSHFESKDDLFSHVLLKEFDVIIAGHEDRVRTLGERALPAFVDLYLSRKHLQDVSRGCAFVALGADIHRQSPKTKLAYDRKMRVLLQTMAKSLPGSCDQTAFVSFVFSTLIGALVLGRSMGDTAAAQELLSSTKKQLLSVIEHHLKQGSKSS